MYVCVCVLSVFITGDLQESKCMSHLMVEVQVGLWVPTSEVLYYVHIKFDHISEIQLFVETWYYNTFLTTYAVIPTKSYATYRMQIACTIMKIFSFI